MKLFTVILSSPQGDRGYFVSAKSRQSAREKVFAWLDKNNYSKAKLIEVRIPSSSDYFLYRDHNKNIRYLP